MIKFDEILEEIRETKKSISETESRRRKYELNRRLRKQLKEYQTAKRYYQETKKAQCEP